MNKIYNINLGGYPFTIDDDAYTELSRYLKTISRHFSRSEGCEDIISDIEIRIAELFNEHLKGQPIVGIREVRKMISIMGTPEEFGASTEDDHIEDTKSRKTFGSETDYNPGRRLFRDPDEAMIGGVCSGISAYLGIEDPVWVRIVFAISLFSGIGAFLYVILWIVLPKAKTSGDRLAMQGERINVSNIAKIIEEEMNNLGDTIVEITKEFGSKKKA